MIIDLTYAYGAMARELEIIPDIKNIFSQNGFDFTKIPFANGSVDTILFDPPHKFLRPSLRKDGGKWGAFVRRYGAFESYADMIAQIHLAFQEIHRVLKVGGLCIFKWADTDCAHFRIVKEIPPGFAVDFKRRISSQQKKSLTLYWLLTKEF